MPTSLVALQILLLLMPGFAATAIIESLAVRAKQSDFQRVISAALCSFLIYSLFAALSRGSLPFHVEAQSTPNAYVTWSVGNLLFLFGLTLIVGVAAVAYINLDWHRAFRKLHLTERTTRHSIWNDIFEIVSTPNQFVQVELEGGRSVLGVLTYYSDDPDDCSVFVSQAAWIDAEGGVIEIPGQGVLLTKNAGIKSISLLKPAENKSTPH